MNGIDPLLYRGNAYMGNNQVEDAAKKLNNKSLETHHEEGTFIERMRKSLPKGISEQISSDSMQKTMNKEEILKDIGNSKEKNKLYEAAEEFEAFFVEKMFKEMRKNVEKNELFHGGFAEEVFDDMLLTERVRSMAFQQNYGIAEKIYQQLQGL